LIVILFLSVSNSNITPFSSSCSFSFSLTLISYDPLSSCLVDFRGRAHMASVKNMQLVQSDPLNNYPTTASAVQEEMLRRDGELEFSLQLGKVSEKNGFKLYFCRLNNLSFFSLSFFLFIYFRPQKSVLISIIAVHCRCCKLSLFVLLALMRSCSGETRKTVPMAYHYKRAMLTNSLTPFLFLFFLPTNSLILFFFVLQLFIYFYLHCFSSSSPPPSSYPSFSCINDNTINRLFLNLIFLNLLTSFLLPFSVCKPIQRPVFGRYCIESGSLPTKKGKEFTDTESTSSTRKWQESMKKSR
jgi:hypothetical protein